MRFAINDKVLLPIFAFVGCSMAMLSSFVWYSAVQQDEIATEQSVFSAQAILQDELDRTGAVARDFSWRNDAVRHLDIAFQENWAASNLNYYVHDQYDYDISIVVNREGQTAFSQIDGRRSVRNAEDLFGKGITRMIAEAQRSPWRKPEAITGLLAVEGSIAMVAVCAVSLEPNANIKMAEGNRVIVILARRFTSAFAVSLMDSPYLQNIALDLDRNTPVPIGVAELLLNSPDGGLIGRLTWSPFLPGRKFLESVAPALGAGVFAILAFTWLLIWRVRTSTRAIEISEERFRDVADISSDWIWETNAKGEIRFLSEQFAISTGTSTDKIIDRPISELLRPIGGVDEIKKFQRDLIGQEHFRGLLCRYSDGTGRARTLRVSGKPVHSVRGSFDGYRGAAIDLHKDFLA